jgi:eukaryotic-like serine/threonine-protein kinase
MVTIGETISHYRILEELGRGGMGVVYRARDEHLPRDVALKVLPPGMFSDETARSRFRREAQTLSQLNHPNIAMVLDFDRENGVDFLAMEFVEGETLAAKVAAGPLPENEVVALGTQIAEALEEAHEHQIIHRDLKPGNVIVTPKGRAKVLDFGLAKLLKPTEADAATASLAETQAGTMMGTVPYMSPEQLQGKPADARTDVYALGTVLYEMATGRRPFPEAQTSQLIAAILTQAPKPARELNAQVSRGFEAIIQKAMERNPEQRYQSAKEFVEDLGRLSVPGSVLVARRRKTSMRRVLFALAGVLVVVAAAGAFWLLRPPPPPRIARIVQLTSTGRSKGYLATDGLRIYFTEAGTSMLQQVSVTGGDVSAIPTPTGPWQLINVSPDGSKFLVRETAGCSDCPLKVMPTTGGITRKLGDLVGDDAAWSPDGRRIAYSKGNDLFLADGDGNNSRKLITLPGTSFLLRWSPDGQRLRFSMWDLQKTRTFLWEVFANGTKLHRVLADRTDPQCCGDWTADGNYFIFRAGRDRRDLLWATREKRGLFRRGSAEVVPLTDGVTVYTGVVPAREANKFFSVGEQWRGELVRYDRSTRQFLPFLSGISAEWVEFSRDGKWVTYVSFPQNALWRSRADGSERLQLTFLPMAVMAPRWSPDGTRIAFMGFFPSTEQGFTIHVISSDGGSPQLLFPEARGQADPQWSPDGNQILFGRWVEGSPNKSFALHLFDLRTKQVSTLPGSVGLFSPRWSRDGRYVVALDSASPALMLFDFTTQRWETLAKPGGGFQNWSKDGEYVYYQGREGNPGVFRAKISSRKVERVASLEQIRTTGALGSWLGIASDDSPLMLRDTSISEIYALELEAP